MIILSILLFLLSLIIYFVNKTKLNLGIWVYLFFVFIFLSFIDIYYIFNYFTWKWLDSSVLYYFLYGWEGTGWLEYKKIFFVSVLSFIIILTIFYWLVNYYLKKKDSISKNAFLYKKLSYIILFFSFLFNPLVNNILEINWFYEISNSTDSSNLLFSDYYYKPTFTDISNKKNIVYIYLESYEKTYLNEDIFPWLSNWLNDIKNNSTFFDNLYQAYWTSWTIAWIVWSQCWIPLEIPWNTDKSETVKKYLKWAFCIWDFLKNAWYNLNYVWWSSMWFAWKWTFYKTHWFDNIQWKDEYIADLENKDYTYSWWLYDDTTFEKAYKKYDELSKIDTPFWLFMITMDTHWDDGVISDSCKGHKYNDDTVSILNSYHCTDYLLSQFIEKLKNHPSFKNTVIVIWSDHYAMDNNNSSEILKENKESRWLLFMIYDSDKTNDKIINKKWDTLDIWATVLSFLGFSVDRLWLWIDLLDESKIRNPGIVLSKWKDDYKLFW